MTSIFLPAYHFTQFKQRKPVGKGMDVSGTERGIYQFDFP
jgi:hypothetical protein